MCGFSSASWPGVQEVLALDLQRDGAGGFATWREMYRVKYRNCTGVVGECGEGERTDTDKSELTQTEDDARGQGGGEDECSSSRAFKKLKTNQRRSSQRQRSWLGEALLPGTRAAVGRRLAHVGPRIDGQDGKGMSINAIVRCIYEAGASRRNTETGQGIVRRNRQEIVGAIYAGRPTMRRHDAQSVPPLQLCRPVPPQRMQERGWLSSSCRQVPEACSRQHNEQRGECAPPLRSWIDRSVLSQAARLEARADAMRHALPCRGLCAVRLALDGHVQAVDRRETGR